MASRCAFVSILPTYPIIFIHPSGELLLVFDIITWMTGVPYPHFRNQISPPPWKWTQAPEVQLRSGERGMNDVGETLWEHQLSKFVPMGFGKYGRCRTQSPWSWVEACLPLWQHPLCCQQDALQFTLPREGKRESLLASPFCRILPSYVVGSSCAFIPTTALTTSTTLGRKTTARAANIYHIHANLMHPWI